MTPERWQHIKSALHEAMSLNGGERAAYLEELGASDADLRGEVESLLAADENAGVDFLSEPPLAALGLPPLQTRFIGRRLGPYRLTEEIGAGGMGEVYKAVRADEEYQHEVAIKLVHTGAGPSFVGNRLRAERQILASLQHPNIARLLDGGTTDEGIPYLVMELIDGQPITEYCSERGLDTTARLKLFIQVCGAAQYAHQRMVIHRDLKPSNILVTREGVPKLLDFGIAKLLEPGKQPSGADLTIASLGILTPQYASPEQLQGESVTTASDVYSLGVLLYELLTGVRPYALPDKTPLGQRMAALGSEPKRPSIAARQNGAPEKLQRRLRGDLDRIVLMALRKEPERRYGTVDQFAEDIRRHLQHRPVLARPPTLGYLATTFVARHTVGVVLSALIVLALAGGIIAIAREERIAERHRAHAEQRFNDVRKLANALIFDIDDSIRDLPGATASRKLLIDTALRYLGSLSEEAVGDPALQLEMAAAYKRLGDVQGAFQASQDDYAGALKSYRRALALMQSALIAESSNVHARRDMDVLYNSLSDLLWTTGDVPGALSFAQRALADARLLASANASDPENPFWTALYNMDYGYKLFRTGGDIGSALGYMRSSLVTLEPLLRADPKSARLRRLLCVSYYKISEALLYERQFAEALSMNQKAGRVLEPAIAAAPADPDLRVNLAATEHYAAAALMNLGRLEEAERYEQAALSTVQALSAADPKVAEFQGFVGMALTAMAEIAERQEQSARAITLLSEALRASDAALSAGTMHPYIRHSKGKAESLLGSAYATLASDTSRNERQRLEDWRMAREWYQRALKSFGDIRSIWTEAARDTRHVTDEIARCDRMLARR